MFRARVLDWPNPGRLIGNDNVEIRLEYRDEIPADKPSKDHRSDLKQQIRRIFSDQLRRRWRDSPVLSKHQAELPDGTGLPDASWDGTHYRPEDKAWPFFRVGMCGFAWVPLVTWHNNLSCELDITFEGAERSALTSSGDLDNRLKTLFDALRMPRTLKEVPGNMFGKGQQLYCLLEDDSLIRKFSVTAVQSPFSPAEHSAVVVAKVVTLEGYEPHPALDRFR